ncbi:MAG: thrombospondin type 3 repeat-containing protein [Acidobacteriota bacterium]|nr:thrombospondin type 3 repeat-containing protein [Acidobacteriota bacterium]
MKKLLPFFILIFTVGVNAATFTVNRSDDRNAVCISGVDCSLREAVNMANVSPSDDIINFATGLMTITLTDEIVINDTGALTINGLGADVLTIDGGAGTNRIFFINNVTMTISGVTLTGGNGTSATQSINNGNGGAILASGGSLSLDGVHVTGNAAVSTFANGFGGGVYFSGGTHRIINSTFSGNTAGAACAGFANTGALIVINSTISGNTATSSTSNSGGFCNVGSATLRNVTITNNTANSGGGFNQGQGTLNLGNTIVAGNIATNGNFPEIVFNGGVFISAGNNLVGDSPGDSTFTGVPITYQPTDIRDMNPMLGALQNNGGTTPTHALLAGSPAIDVGNNTLTSEPFDQRGAGFPRIVDGNNDGTAIVDIGAFEVQIGDDADNDGIADANDNCPMNPNPDQLDTDNDAIGNVCDDDDDNDSILDTIDNCPLLKNRTQLDFDFDGIGDACDPTPGSPPIN